MVPVVRKRVIVSGKVQGVWFRQSAAREATSLGICGWIRNRPDGSVEAVFEGAHDLVDMAVEWAGHGPDRASVEHIEVIDEKPTGELGFNITG